MKVALFGGTGFVGKYITEELLKNNNYIASSYSAGAKDTVQVIANNDADVSIPVGSSLELLSGGKVVMETTDILKVDCSVTDKVSGTLSIMEIT